MTFEITSNLDFLLLLIPNNLNVIKRRNVCVTSSVGNTALGKMGTNLDDEVVVEGGRRLEETLRRPRDGQQVVLVQGHDALVEK